MRTLKLYSLICSLAIFSSGQAIATTTSALNQEKSERQNNTINVKNSPRITEDLNKTEQEQGQEQGQEQEQEQGQGQEQEQRQGQEQRQEQGESTQQSEQNLMERGIKQVKSLWQRSDGTVQEMEQFCKENYIKDEKAKKVLFTKLSKAFEQFLGYGNQLSIDLKKPVHLTGDELTQIDYIMGNYEPLSHFAEDMYTNKVAFITMLNFPAYTLAEKNRLGKEWTRLQWAYARMGDMFTSRVPASLSQKAAEVNGNAENYIAEYNIIMDKLVDDKGQKLFPDGMVLLSHWNLRDEIKSNYAKLPNALKKQEMIYKVMEHIVNQTIPKEVINNPKYTWNPYSNKIFLEGKEVTAHQEGAERYKYILNQFKVELQKDKYNANLSTGILRNFEGGMEISAEEIENLFINLISSKEVKEVAKLIKKRLGRELKPYDIWYDGFKSRSSLSEEDLSAQTRAKYPTPEAFQKDMPRMLQNLGFEKNESEYIASKIVVEGARGSGHAWGSTCKWDKAHLRTRISPLGMDYKGYNIAVHEFGHNVEQTLDLYDIDYYMLNGVPNTAFTETLAFIFQKRDLQLLGYNTNKNANAAGPANAAALANAAGPANAAALANSAGPANAAGPANSAAPANAAAPANSAGLANSAGPANAAALANSAGPANEIDPNTALDIFWGAYEIMGVSLVDMYSWRWLYENPDATAEQLKEAVIKNAKEVWNKYYYPVLGTKDSPILGIYSHMVNSPMYLPNYPFGHIIEFQMEDYFAGEMVKKGKTLPQEIKRIYTLGRLTPQIWMQQAVGSNVSTDPLIKAIGKILKNYK
jgi:hypothetical protein